MTKRHSAASAPALEKCPTGIPGLDEITEGGLPRGRPTLICGGAGSGKTLLSMEFLVRGITQYNEPGVFMAFEETAEELAKNVASLGFNVPALIAANKMAIDYVHIERSEIEETGEYDLEGLFVRLNSMMEQVSAKRVVLDTVEALFAGLPNEAILRAELRRLFRWLKAKGITVIITGEQGDSKLTRYGIEEYVSDCVIFLDHRVVNQIATRRLRIIKYRGSRHGTNEYPTLIDENGMSVLPISSLGLTYPVSMARISTGMQRLDAMLGNQGYYKGSTILVSGTAGTGKSSIAAAFANSVCHSGSRFMYVSLEESAAQIVRNMRSIGIDLGKWQKSGRLKFHTVRPTLYGLEMHLATIHKIVSEFKPDALAMDPVTNMTAIAEGSEAKAMLTRLVDFLKNLGITALFTSLTNGGDPGEQTEVGISSLMDTWLLLRMVESENERNRLLYILKSRGMDHSNQMREFRLTNGGIQLMDVYVGPGQVYTGSARVQQEARDRQAEVVEVQSAAKRSRLLSQEEAALRAQIEALQAKLADVSGELKSSQAVEMTRLGVVQKDRRDMRRSRQGDGAERWYNGKTRDAK